MIKTVVIGFGFASKVFHLPHLIHSSKYEVVGIVSSSGASKQDAIYQHIPVYSTLAEAFRLSEASLYIINTPSDQHFEMVKQCLLNNKDAVVEKPAFLTIAEGEELIQLEKNSKAVISVHQNRRWDGDFITIQKLLQEKQIGEWKVLESRFDRFRPTARNRWREVAGAGSGILYDLGSHLIDQALVLFGEPDAIYAEVMTQREHGQTDDGFVIILHYSEKRIYIRSSSFINAPYPRFELHGTAGSFVKFGLDQQEQQLIDGSYYTKKVVEHGTLYKEEAREIELEQGGYNTYFELLADYLQKRQPLVPLTEALLTTKYIELALTSSREGRRIEL